MPKITKVEPQKTLRLRSGRKRFNIYLDDKFAFGADEDLIVNYRLLPGKIIEPEDLEKLLFEAKVGKLMEQMYSLFAIRARSEKEIRDKLRTKNFQLKIKDKEQLSGMVIDSLIQRLKDKQLLNDSEFAKSWVESRRKSKQKGKMALKSELMQKGINRELIEEVVNLQSTGDSEIQLAEQALGKKIYNWRNLATLEFKKKAYGFLARKGFDSTTILGLLSPAKIANYLKKE